MHHKLSSQHACVVHSCLYRLRLSEWRLGDASDNCAVYTFLYDTFHLQLIYADSNGAICSQLTFSIL